MVGHPDGSNNVRRSSAVFAINLLAVARHRDRHSVARKKSDAVDAAVPANIPRTDMAAHRPLLADSELVPAIAVLARARQDAVWDRGRAQGVSGRHTRLPLAFAVRSALRK
ncbi:Transposase [Streptomyces malaysiensis subsp. malaysiensis]|nr:Transposase [Streptomyces sp. M56]